MVIKTKKTKKAKGLRGKTTHGHGARKKWKKSGHKGGVGMAGSGKRGDQKKTLIIKKYGNKYFGKKGITSKGTAKKKVKKINLIDIEKNYDSLMDRFGKGDLLDLSEYKLLGKGELKRKVKIRVLGASSGAIDGVEKVGGEVEVLAVKDEERVVEDIDSPGRDKDKDNSEIQDKLEIKDKSEIQEENEDKGNKGNRENKGI